ncbi:MAG TPA: hemerythrin domain-containing protein [Telluria sp.]|jgi:hemerythrin superfamily protein
MPTQGKKKSSATTDALDLLKADHDKVRNLFREFEQLRGSDDEDERKSELVDEICYELTLHTMIEEEIFYPALRAASDDAEMMDEADIEHAGARELISQLEVMYPGDDHFDATVTVLGEEVIHHIEKEERDMFAAARSSGIDLAALGEQLTARTEELDEDLSAPPPTMDAMAPHNGTRRPPRAPN